MIESGSSLTVTDVDSNAPSPYFSIIINIYNGEVHLREAIDSALAQTFTDFEIILWDDGSTDSSREICASYTDSRIHYYRLATRISVAAARAGAVEQARGTWLAFLDQDDIWLPHKLAAQYALIERHGNSRLGLVYGRTVRFDGRGRRSVFDGWHGRNRLPEGNIFSELLRRPSFVALSSAVIRRDAFIERCQAPNYLSLCPDYYYCLAVSRAYDSACVQEPCCLYRVHQKSMSRVYRKEIHEEALRIIETVAVSPAQRRILRHRQMVHQTWIGLEEIRGRGTLAHGIMRILLKGSVAYLMARPLVMLFRRIRHGELIR